MDRDDSPVGRVLSRREVLTVLGASGLALLAGGTQEALARADSRRRLPACVARPEQTAGPYFVDAKLNRSDIRSDAASGEVKEGAPLDLVLAVSAFAREAARRWQARTWTSGIATPRVCIRAWRIRDSRRWGRPSCADIS